MIATLYRWSQQANKRFLPFWAFLALSLIGGIFGAWVGWPLLAHALSGLDTEWGWDSRAWFFGAGVALVAFAFAAVNFLLRLLDREGLNVTLPPLFQPLGRLRPVSALGWAGFIPIAIGVVIGKTIFT